MLFNRRNDAIKCLDDYCSMILEAKRKATDKLTKGKGSKLLNECLKNY